MCNDHKYSVRLFSRNRIYHDTITNWSRTVQLEEVPSRLVEIWCHSPKVMIYVTVDGIIHKVCSDSSVQVYAGRILECIRYGSDTHTGITCEQLQKVFQSLKIPFDNTAIEIMVHML